MDITKNFGMKRLGMILVAVVIAAFAMYGVVSALIEGTAASTGNTVTATGADIQVQDTNEVYASAVADSLTAAFIDTTEEILAGFIDVKNNGGDNLAVGYVITNAANPAPSGAADVALNTEVQVIIESMDTFGSGGIGCSATSGQAGQTVVVIETAFDALTSGTITGVNTAGAEQALCFYLTTTVAGNDIAGGSVVYDLTFTAS